MRKLLVFALASIRLNVRDVLQDVAIVIVDGDVVDWLRWLIFLRRKLEEVVLMTWLLW